MCVYRQHPSGGGGSGGGGGVPLRPTADKAN